MRLEAVLDAAEVQGFMSTPLAVSLFPDGRPLAIKACKAGGDGLLACSFCTAVYHNTETCLGEARVANEALAKSVSFLWACPACFKKGVAAVQRATLKPTGQRAAGAKKPRKKRAKK